MTQPDDRSELVGPIIFDEMVKAPRFEVWLDGPATGFKVLVSLGFTSANNLTADECAAWVAERLRTK